MEAANLLVLVFLALIFFISIITNLLLLIFTIKIYKRELASNFYISGICLADMLSATFGIIPEFIVNYRPDFIDDSNLLCISAGLITLAFCIVTINLFGILAFVQALAIIKPFVYRRYFTQALNNILIVFVVIIYGLFWAVLPYSMNSKYVPDLDGRRCSLDWKDKDMKYYIIACTVIGLFVPVGTQIISLFKSRRQLMKRKNEAHAKRILGYEKFYIKISTIIVTVFLMVWTPYTVVGFMIVFGYYPSKIAFTVCAMSAKLATLCNPVVYYCYSQRFKRFVRQILRLKWCDPDDDLQLKRTSVERQTSITSTMCAVIANAGVYLPTIPESQGDSPQIVKNTNFKENGNGLVED
uniref:Opsin 4 n=1 Tax=Clytia hemisphaerica TaxID=252671 RepID=A0A2I6SFT0_9CNID|nr:opsin 4 [Clytia hemisphaerica]